MKNVRRILLTEGTRYSGRAIYQNYLYVSNSVYRDTDTDTERDRHTDRERVLPPSHTIGYDNLFRQDANSHNRV